MLKILALVFALHASAAPAPFSYTSCYTTTDKMVAMYDAMLGTSGSGLGVGDTTFGYSAKLNDLAGIVAALGDNGQLAVLSPLAQNWPSTGQTSALFGAQMYSFYNGLDRVGANAGSLLSAPSVSSFDTLQYYYNFGNGSAYWQCLAHPDWLYVYQSLHGGSNPNPLNLYFECLQGGSYGATTFTYGLGEYAYASSTWTPTAGYTIPFATYAGGFPYFHYSGATYSGGSTATITITGTDQAGNAETFTGTLSGATGDIALTGVTHSYSLITSSSAAAVSVHSGSTCTAVTGYVEAHRPSGRSNPPS